MIYNFKKQLTYSKLFEIVNKYGINSSWLGNDGEQLMRIFQKKEFPKSKISHINTSISLKDIIPKLGNKRIITDYFNNLDFSIWDKNVCYDVNFQYILGRDFQKDKIVYLSYCYEDYFLDEKDEGIVHSVSLLFVPEDGKYNVYYVNSHGNDLKDYKNFTYKHTKTRKKTLSMHRSFELLFLDELIKYMNKSCKLNCVFNENHIYYGPNLQEADNHGLCFLFPQMMYIYLEYRCEERHASRIFNEETIYDFILNCMSMYDPKINDIKNTYIDEVGNLEAYFRKQKHHIPRKILNHVIGLLTQDKYIKKIKA